MVQLFVLNTAAIHCILLLSAARWAHAETAVPVQLHNHTAQGLYSQPYKKQPIVSKVPYVLLSAGPPAHVLMCCVLDAAVGAGGVSECSAPSGAVCEAVQQAV